MELGIIGLPGSGKTTVFNAVTRGRADTSPSGQASLKPNIGVAKVIDPRLDVLADMFHPQRIVPAEVRYVDVPGAPDGLGKSQSIGGEYLNTIQRSDALVLVVRAFDNPTVPHLEGTVDPYRDIATMSLELAFSDIAILERRVERLNSDLKSAKPQLRESANREISLLERLKAGLSKDIPVREQQLDQDERRLISGYQFLTAKPMLVVLNVDESQLPDTASLEKDLGQRLDRPGAQSATMCATMEEELGHMDAEDEFEFRKSLNAGESGALKMIRLSYHLLGYVSFFTVGPDEVRAWSIVDCTPAVKAAGTIHSDIERGFIRAEAVSYGDLIDCGGMQEVRRKGALRLEGKTYPVRDGDVINFLFNV